ncbi:MAG: ATP-dependent Clp protease proteolytic subunit [Phycisphaerales bacterium]
MFRQTVVAGMMAACVVAQPVMGQETTSGATQEKSKVEQMKEELDRLSTEYRLMQQRQKMRLAQAELEKSEIDAKQALRESRLKDELAASRAETARLKAEAEAIKARAALESARQAQQLAEMRAQIERREVEQRLADAEAGEGVAEARRRAMEIDAETSVARGELAALKTRYDMMTLDLKSQLATLEREIDLREQKDKLARVVTNDMSYREEPFRDGTLYISDRRIPLNGPIWSGTGSYVADRIQFFNNQSEEQPIFIVIDSSPGGSVMEGYRILKAMETSRAPIHVVVKSFAASMAACITTLADHSYAYPNAILLHHQMSSGMRGNMTQQKEQYENSLEWQRRLAEPIAEKMGVSLDRFVELMYENNSNGDWEEFAQEAVSLRWVNHIVTEARETGLRDHPGSAGPTLPMFFEAMKTDENGRRYIELPPLQPFDHYFMYDPNNFYREAR